MFSEAGTRGACDPLIRNRSKFVDAEPMPSGNANFRDPRQNRSVLRCRGIIFHEGSRELEEGRRIHLAHLVAHWRRRVDVRIDCTALGCMLLAISAERNKSVLILNRPHGPVVFTRSRAVCSAEEPYQVRG